MMEKDGLDNKSGATLLASVFIIAACALLYELLIGTMSSYLLGGSVLHYSITIGIFLFAMGIGSYLSRYMDTGLLERFIRIEIALGILGGFSAFILYYAFAHTGSYHIISSLLILALGMLTGLEIPLVTRMVQQYQNLKDALAKVLAFDYIGALLASFLFPLLMLPYLGLMRTSFLVGILNLLVAVITAWSFRGQIGSFRKMAVVCSLGFVLLVAGFAWSLRLQSFFEHMLYQDEIILSEQTPYQRIIMTKYGEDVRLFLDGNLQFSSTDEYRYHEVLVHVPLLLAPRPENVLLLGGGDGLAVREILKHKEVKSITLVDLDPGMTHLSISNRALAELNGHSLTSPKVKIVNADAFAFLQQNSGLYSTIIADLPDPNNHSLNRLYTTEFYRLAQKHLAADGVFITQATSPYFAPAAFWSIYRSVAEAFPAVVPLNVYVPSFGQWGFVMASRTPGLVSPLANKLQQSISDKGAQFHFRFLNREVVPALIQFSADMKDTTAEANTLSNQKLLDYYENSWRKWE